MASLHSSVMMGHVPLYLDGSLSYISSRSFRPSPTLEPSDPILNTASILLSLYSLSPPRALSSRQVLYLLAALDTSLGCDLLVCEDSRSLLTPRRPPHLHHHSATRFFTHSPLLTFLTSSFPYTLPLSQSSVNTVIGICALSRPTTLHSKQPRGRSGTSSPE
jgi:hypothetical protein